jgi:hypothetical protein
MLRHRSRDLPLLVRAVERRGDAPRKDQAGAVERSNDLRKAGVP